MIALALIYILFDPPPFSLDFHWDEWAPVATQVWQIVNNASGDLINIILLIFLSIGFVLALINVMRGSDNF